MKLTRPEALRDICCTKALTVCGEEKTAAELLAEIEKDMPFYNGGGGVTLSGGEPLAQDETLIEFLQLLAAKKIDTAVETSLHVPWQLVQRCIRVVNTFLVDVKHTDQVKFHRFTGGDINLVYQNLVKIARQHPHVIARIPVIPGFNHTLAEMVRIIDFIHSLDTIREIHFLRYHSLGKQKYQMLGMKYLMGNDRQVSESELEEYIGYGRKKGFQVRVGG